VQDISFRPMTRADLPLLRRWLAQPHVARWWGDPPNEAAVEAEYGADIDGTGHTEHHVILVDDRPIGHMQWYVIADYPDWEKAIGVAIPTAATAGIDYLIGEPEMVGKGIGPRAIAAYSELIFAARPDVEVISADLQQANRPSWRALEKAGFERRWAGLIASDAPEDAGPAYVYTKRRDH
jgi:aminoglycoside 6'-N-acetyltransferase